MAKTKRLIRENLQYVDMIIELLDARIPYSSRNPEIKKLVSPKPVLTVLNKASLADDTVTEKWCEYFAEKDGSHVIATDCSTGQGIAKIDKTVKIMMSEKLRRYSEKGMNVPIRAMILGIPNVGKSTLTNKLCGSKKAAVEDRPGVTMTKQWVKTSIGLELLDMPGVLWPKFEDVTVGENLAATGAIKDTVLIREDVAFALLKKLIKMYPGCLCKRYGLTRDELDIEKSGHDADDENGFVYDVYLSIGRKRGLLLRGGEVDEERCAVMLLDEFRAGKTGRITLDVLE